MSLTFYNYLFYLQITQEIMEAPVKQIQESDEQIQDIAEKSDEEFLRDIELQIRESLDNFREYVTKDFELNLFLASLTFPTSSTQSTFVGSGPLLLFDLFHKWNILKQPEKEGLEFVATFRTPQQFLRSLNCKIPAAFHLVRS
jgi:hypothetical protein